MDESFRAQQQSLGESSTVHSRDVGLNQGKIKSFLSNVHGLFEEQQSNHSFSVRPQNPIPTQDRRTVIDSSALDQEIPEDGDCSDDEVVVLEPANIVRVIPGRDNDESDDDIEIVDTPSWAYTPKVIDLTEETSTSFHSRPLKRKRPDPVIAKTQKKTNSKDDPIQGQLPKQSAPERRYVFHSESKKTTTFVKNNNVRRPEDSFNATMSNEDAAREQERLFRESAARVRSCPKFQVTDNNASTTNGRKMVTFPHRIVDVQKKFPDHWTYTDNYARLGLPRDAPLQLVKMHYRTLARVYHPDKSGTDHTARRFQAIAEAYDAIMSQR